MTDPIVPVTPPEATPPATPAPEPAPEATGELTNAQIKASPLFQKLTSELAAATAGETARTEKEEADKLKAEEDKLIASGEFEAALKLRDDRLDTQKKTFDAELLQRDLKIELSTAGFSHPMFVNGAVAGFEGGASDVGAYVKGLAENELNAAFLSAGTVPRETLPVPAGAKGGGQSMSVEDARRIAKESDDPKVRQQARMVLKADFDKRMG